MIAIKYLEPNTKGRSFVVGDIHGSFELIVEALKKTNFDWEADRLYVVGDLIDRGPESHRCAKFLRLPCVHSVLGNHEKMLLDLYEDGNPPEAVLKYFCQFNGLNWWLSTSESLRQEILHELRKLPLILEVQTNRGSVGFLHAEVPMGMDWETFKNKVKDGDEQTVHSCLWGRERAEYNFLEGVPGIGRIFVGHTPHQKGMVKRGNVYFIDTGAVFGLLNGVEQGHLTFANVLTATATLVAPKMSPGLVEIKDDEIVPVNPFGVYL